MNPQAGGEYTPISLRKAFAEYQCQLIFRALKTNMAIIRAEA